MGRRSREGDRQKWMGAMGEGIEKVSRVLICKSVEVKKKKVFRIKNRFLRGLKDVVSFFKKFVQEKPEVKS